jgi:hypothetical protein
MHDEEVILALAGMFFVFGLPFLGCMFWMVLHYLNACLRNWQEIRLKRDMIARGYTVQEIVDVVSAKRGGKQKGKHSDVPPQKPIKHPAYATN